MPKRKLSDAQLDIVPAKKRLTRSASNTIELSTSGSSSKGDLGLDGSYWSPSKKDARPPVSSRRQEDASKENEDPTTVQSSDEELNIVPVLVRKPTAAATNKDLPTLAKRPLSPTIDSDKHAVGNHTRPRGRPAAIQTPKTDQWAEPATTEVPESQTRTKPVRGQPQNALSSFQPGSTPTHRRQGRKASPPPLPLLKPPGEATTDDDVLPVIVSPRKRASRKVGASDASPKKAALFPKEIIDVDASSDSITVLEIPTLPVDQTKKSPLRKRPALPQKSARTQSPTRLPRVLSPHLVPSLTSCKHSILRHLRTCGPHPLQNEDSAEASSSDIAFKQLQGLLRGTVERGEGNSCMLIGPRGSGKTKMMDHLLGEFNDGACKSEAIIIRLSGHAQYNDRLAMREIVRQLVQQTNLTDFNIPEDEDDEEENGLVMDREENPFLDDGDSTKPSAEGVSIRLPPTAHLPSLIGTLPTLGRPVIVVLDGFDLFALHARQALLYCLLDTVQHSHSIISGSHYGSSDGTNLNPPNRASGLAVIGVTTRVDTLELLEKRVKSRFSGRIMRTAGPAKWQTWETIVRQALESGISEDSLPSDPEWTAMWGDAVDNFMASPDVKELLLESVSLVKDISMVTRILSALALSLSPEQPWPTVELLRKVSRTQRCPPRTMYLDSLHYPSLCLLIAAIHARTAGHEQFTFEQLHNDVHEQVRRSTAAPVQMEGGSIGMLRCGRGVLMGAFEQLVSMKIFPPVAAAGAAANMNQEFVKYRCVPEREAVKAAVDKSGQTNLKKWLGKAQ